ncbi:sugar phosphate isomerase/epimerase family protein [Paenibacillus sp. strain BS8-2]
MKYSICSISFRHQLISYEEIVRFAREQGYDGIELWGAHACQMYATVKQAGASQGEPGLARHPVTMISDYLAIVSDDAMSATMKRCDQLLNAAEWLEVRRLRTFAGCIPSASTTESEREGYVRRLRRLCERCASRGVELLIETHPDTLADTVESTLQLIAEVNHPALRINLDFLHAWEGGSDPLDAYWILKPWVSHLHLKNITSADRLSVFAPANVYSAAGDRAGMTRLGDGVIAYDRLLSAMQDELEAENLFASVEWFGDHPSRVLRKEIAWLRQFDRLSNKATLPAGAIR